MGKGDKKTKRGKIIMGSYGVTRPHKTASVSSTAEKKKGIVGQATSKAKPKATKNAKEE